MQLFFQNPGWWWLGLLAVVPLIVHLVARAKPQLYRYPSLRFLQEVVRKSARWQKPQDWLVWLLRTLALLALIFGILGPLLMKEGNVPGARKTLVIVVDRSASMAFEERFGEATSQALQALREKKPDLANLIWIDSSPAPFSASQVQLWRAWRMPLSGGKPRCRAAAPRPLLLWPRPNWRKWKASASYW